jgi:hypothetical protein
MACMSISVNCHFVTYSLHISLKKIILNHSNGIVDLSSGNCQFRAIYTLTQNYSKIGSLFMSIRSLESADLIVDTVSYPYCDLELKEATVHSFTSIFLASSFMDMKFSKRVARNLSPKQIDKKCGYSRIATGRALKF